MNKKFVILILLAALCLSLSPHLAHAQGSDSEHVHTPKAVILEATNGSSATTIYYCEGCDKCFSDDLCNTPIAKPYTPEITDYTALEWKVQSDVDITFTINVPLAHCEAVVIDGDTLQKDEYTWAKNGTNTEVTIKARAFAQLSVQKHRLYVTTSFGTAQIDFLVVPAQTPQENPTIVTFDIGQLVLILSVSILAVVCVVLAVMYFIQKKKNDNNSLSSDGRN